MPIHLISGVPGAGKTARMVQMLVSAAKRGDRPVYAAGIDGLADGLAEPLDDPTQWRDLPDGSLVFVDEAWKWFGHLHDARGKPTPPHVLDFAEHRHTGLDFVFTSQGPNQLFPFLRPLIAPHDHCVRRFGTHMIDVYKWGELVEEVKSQGMRERADKEVTILPKEIFPLYKSASIHTIRAKFPRKLLLLPIVLIAAPLLLWYAYTLLKPDPIPAMVTQEAGAALAAAASTAPADVGRTRQDETLTAADWLAMHTPRIAGVHGSAPIFDGREARSEPATYCVMSGQGGAERCRCYTEQVTPLQGIPDDVCRYVARHGEYDPYRAPLRTGRSEQSRPGAKDAEEPSTASGAGEPRIGVNYTVPQDVPLPVSSGVM